MGRGARWWCGVCLAGALLLATGCAEELSPQEPRGAYLLFRQAVLSGDAAQVYAFMDKDTRKVFDDRYQTLNAMDEQILRFLPQVDQKLARQQTGVVFLKERKITSGEELFKAVFQAKQLEVTPEIEVGTEVSDVEVNAEESEAAVVTYSGQVYRLVKEDDGLWRVASWQELVTSKTGWVQGNQTALEQTVSDLINEESAEVDKVIEHILAQEKRRAEAAPR